MTIDKSKTPDERAERNPTKSAPEEKAQAARLAFFDRWSRRLSFWRAVAGMALAVALACAASALETAFESSSRSASFQRRLELAGARVLRLRTEAADAERQLAAMRAERASAASINRVLTAADVVILPLRDGATNARGLLALSSQESGATVVISGLTAIAGQSCLLWWLLSRGPPLKAAQFKPDTDGRVLLAIRLPRGGCEIVGALLTIESGQRERASGIILKGELPRAELLNFQKSRPGIFTRCEAVAPNS